MSSQYKTKWAILKLQSRICKLTVKKYTKISAVKAYQVVEVVELWSFYIEDDWLNSPVIRSHVSVSRKSKEQLQKYTMVETCRSRN